MRTGERSAWQRSGEPHRTETRQDPVGGATPPAGVPGMDPAPEGEAGPLTPSPAGPAATVAGAYDRLDAAIHGLLARREAWAADALGYEEAETRLHELVDAATGIVPVVPPDAAGVRILQQRLLDLLRAELLSAHPAGVDADADAALLTLLGRLEEIRQALDPAYHQLLPARLAGTDALTLVVEVVHDLRSPLTSIMFLAETLRKGSSGPINDAQRKQLGIVYSAALALTTVATDVIALARGGDIQPESEAPFSIHEVFHSVRDMVLPLAEEKDLDLRFGTLIDEPRMGNSIALGRVLLNLVTNALKFTEKGHIEVSAEERGSTVVEFSVRDTGRGMEHPDPNVLFQPFHRTTYKGGLRFSGTGLGLSMCRRTVEMLGGELQYQSQPDQGTRFFFALNLPKVSRF